MLENKIEKDKLNFFIKSSQKLSPIEAINSWQEDHAEDKLNILSWGVDKKIFLPTKDLDCIKWHRRLISTNINSYNSKKIKNNYKIKEKISGTPLEKNTNPISNILENHFERIKSIDEGSLFLIKCPTGIGKTYNVALKIFEHLKKFLDAQAQHKKIYFVTDLLDNVKDAYENLMRMIEVDKNLSEREKQILKMQVVKIPSQYEIINNLSEEKFLKYIKILGIKNVDHFVKIFYDIKSCALFLKKQKIDKKIFAKIDENARLNSSLIYKELINKIREKIKANQKYRSDMQFILEISELLPGELVNLGYASVVFMTTKKMLSGYDTFQYKFKPIEEETGALIFIDEFDKQSKVILDHILESKPIDLISTVKDIDGKISTQNFEKSKSFEDVDACFKKMKEIGSILTNIWKINNPIGLSEGLIKNNNITLFSDKISMHLSNTDEKFYMIFDDKIKKTLINSSGDDERSLQIFLKDANDYCNSKFPQSCQKAASTLIKNQEDESCTVNMAIQIILNNIALNNYYSHIIDRLNFSPVRKRKNPIGTNCSYHLRGMKLIELVVPENDKYTVKAMHHAYELSPTAILATLILNGNHVVGISATANCKSVLHNFDLDFLKSQLTENNYFELNQNEINDVMRYYNKKRNYEDNDVKLNVEFKDSNIEILENEVRRQYGNDSDFGNIVHELFCNNDRARYQFCINWVTKLMAAISDFISNKNQKYMLCLLNRCLKNKNAKLFFENYVSYLAEHNSIIAEIYCSVDAKYLREEYRENVIKTLEKKLSKVIVISTYATMGAGTNVDYTFDSNFEFSTPVSVDDNSFSNNRTDIDCLYLESPKNMFSISSNEINGEPSLIEAKMRIFHEILSLKEAYEIPYELAKNWCKDILSCGSYKAIEIMSKKIQKEYKNTDDYYEAMFSKIEQAVGRMARTTNKRKDISIYLDEDLVKILKMDKRGDGNILFSKEYMAILNSNKLKYKTEKCKNKLTYLADINNRKTASQIKYLLNNIFQSKSDLRKSIKEWKWIRNQVLSNPTAYEINNNLNYLYLKSEHAARYQYEHGNYDPCTNLNRYKFFTGNNLVSEESSGLKKLMENDIVKSYFIEKGYATIWQEFHWIINPIAFSSLYKGAIGEAAGEAILSNCGIEFISMENKNFEMFDSKLRYNNQYAYIDFKFWDLNKWNALEDSFKQDTLKKIINKANNVNCKKIIICNVYDDNHSTILAFDINAKNVDINDKNAVVLSVPTLIVPSTMEVNKYAINIIKRWIENNEQ